MLDDGHAENGSTAGRLGRLDWKVSQPRSCTTSRLRCSSLRLNVRTAAASAASRLGASTIPRTWARFRMSDARQERDAVPRGFVLADFRIRERDDMEQVK